MRFFPDDAVGKRPQKTLVKTRDKSNDPFDGELMRLENERTQEQN